MENPDIGFTVHVSSGSGYGWRPSPKALRDNKGFADTRSWAAWFKDPTLACSCDELVFGPAAQVVASLFDVTVRQAARILPQMTFVHREEKWLVARVNSLHTFHESYVSSKAAIDHAEHGKLGGRGHHRVLETLVSE